MNQLMRCVSVHWDLENMAVPRGASVIQVCNRIRDAVMGTMGEINAFYAYLDVGSAPRKLRQELAMAGLDLIDCSSASGKPGQVDLRIVARALRSSPAEGVAIVSGDADYAYVLSSLRSARRLTALVYNSNNASAVSTMLLEVAHLTLPIPFEGEPENGAGNEEAGACATPSTASSASQTPQDQLVAALQHAPEAEDGGWKTGPTVGALFRKLCNGDNQTFRDTKRALVSDGRVELHDGRDLLRLVG